MEIIAISHNITHTQSYAVVLGEQEGARRLPIVIGTVEAQAIAMAMDKMLSPPRPLTHDLFFNVCKEFSVNVKEIIISNLLEGVFYARLVIENNGEITEIDSRTSDALALAVRFNCPIYTYEFILDQAGIILKENEGESEAPKEKVRTRRQKPSDDLRRRPLSQLNEMLDDAILKEDYERAARLRDEIQKREA